MRSTRKSSSIAVMLLAPCLALSLSVFAEPPASDADHWAFQPIERPNVPEVSDTDWARNPIDHFVLRKLEEAGLTPSPEADRVTLIRRLYLDLLGLPPSPTEVDDFVNDESPYAYESLVNRILASPHFGERWGRHWLDLARYADSDGYEKDTPRPHAWRYRQWVIDAINRDLPYDQFLTQQLAGDLMPNATTEMKVATGFHRNTLTNKEGGVDQEEYRVAQVVDRTNTSGAVFMGLTMACAQCHDHKYDPISQREYFGMYAFFNTAMEEDIPAPLDAEVALLERNQREHKRKTEALRKRIAEERKRLEKELQARESELREKLGGLTWTLLEPESIESSGGATFTTLDDGSILAGGENPLVDTYTVVVPTELTGITGFRLEVLTHDALPRTGPGRAHHGNFILSEFTVTAEPLGKPEAAEPVQFGDAWADFWEEGWPIEEAIDGQTNTGWSANAWKGYNEDRVALFVPKAEVGTGGGTRLTFTFDHQYGGSHAMGRFRLYAATGSHDHLRIPPILSLALEKAPADRSEQERNAVFGYLQDIDPVLIGLTSELEALERTQPDADTTMAQTLVANPDPPETHVHERGDFLSPGEKVSPHTPSVLPPLRADDNPDRLDFAEWLLDPAHPLTARVAANRIWERLFGAGLVLTSEDFGTRGQPPSHPELLDWLATEYRKQGWSRKAMIRLIVTSGAYRQSSDGRSDLAERDPQNRLLARQNRVRVEAEIIRDLFLAASGLLDPTIGGPSVYPPLPDGVRELGYNNSIRWPESEGRARYRRGIYIHFQRTVPFPSLMTFDCPDSNVSAIRRNTSNTPLQALTLLNDPVFFESAQALGRKLAMQQSDDTARLTDLFRQCLARHPRPEEIDHLADLLAAERAAFAEDSDAAARIVGDYLPEGANPADVAPWVTVARAVLNLDEFITRE